MLEISDAQLYVLSGPWRRQVAQRFMLMLHAAWPDRIEALGEDEAFARVLNEVEDGADLGLTDMKDLYLFTSLPVILGWDYADDPEHAWVEAMLFDPEVGPPAQRLALVVEMLRG